MQGFQQGAASSPIKEKQADHHVFAVLPNGDVTIEYWLFPSTLDTELGHARLTASEARALRNFLNSADVRRILGVPFSTGGNQ